MASSRARHAIPRANAARLRAVGKREKGDFEKVVHMSEFKPVGKIERTVQMIAEMVDISTFGPANDRGRALLC
jgi:hypothetical protein